MYYTLKHNSTSSRRIQGRTLKNVVFALTVSPRLITIKRLSDVFSNLGSCKVAALLLQETSRGFKVQSGLQNLF